MKIESAHKWELLYFISINEILLYIYIIVHYLLQVYEEP